ncbi:MAG: sensor histidine kinase [Lachnospiraceae bacterium]|nr:sensor histidine kinase [Lachnospiraceae bacterium]
MNTIAMPLTFYAGLVLFGFLFAPVLKRRTHFPARFIAGLLAGAAIIWLVPDVRILEFLPSTKSLTVYAVFIALQVLCYKGSAKDFLFADICALTAQHFSLCIAEVPQKILEISGVWPSVLFQAGGAAVAFVLLYAVFARRLKDHSHYVDYMDESLIVIGVILFGTIFFAQSAARKFGGITVMYRFFDGLTCFLALYILFIQLSKANEAWEKRLLKELMESEQKRYALLEEGMDAINRKAHDLKYISRAWGASGQEPATDRDMQEEYIEAYDYISRTGCAPLDTVLTEKGLYCRRNHIAFTCLAEGQRLRFMQPADIFVLFGNLLDNAIECVIRYEDPEKRIISVRVTGTEDAVRIRAENYCEDALTFEDGFPVSIKGDRMNHGFGMKSIRYIVEKYHGALSAGLENRLFHVGISLPCGACQSRENVL